MSRYKKIYIFWQINVNKFKVRKIFLWIIFKELSRNFLVFLIYLTPATKPGDPQYKVLWVKTLYYFIIWHVISANISMHRYMGWWKFNHEWKKLKKKRKRWEPLIFFTNFASLKDVKKIKILLRLISGYLFASLVYLSRSFVSTQFFGTFWIIIDFILLANDKHVIVLFQVSNIISLSLSCYLKFFLVVR